MHERTRNVERKAHTNVIISIQEKKCLTFSSQSWIRFKTQQEGSTRGFRRASSQIRAEERSPHSSTHHRRGEAIWSRTHATPPRSSQALRRLKRAVRVSYQRIQQLLHQVQCISNKERECSMEKRSGGIRDLISGKQHSV